MNASTTKPEPTGKFRRLAARFGIAGFLFFLMKGLAWLIVPALVARGLID